MSSVTSLRLIALIYIVHPCGYCSNLYCAPMWFDCTKTDLKKLKVAYNNSLRRFMGLPWHNSASEMFVNLNIKAFGVMLDVLYTVFVQGL